MSARVKQDAGFGVEADFAGLLLTPLAVLALLAISALPLAARVLTVVPNDSPWRIGLDMHLEGDPVIFHEAVLWVRDIFPVHVVAEPPVILFW